MPTLRHIALAALVAACAGPAAAQQEVPPPPSTGPDGVTTREIGRTAERELKVSLSSTFGTVFVSRGDPEKVVVIESSEGGEPLTGLEYAVRDRVGYLDLSLGEAQEHQDHSGFQFGKFDRGSWHLKLSDALPISFDIELGVGKGRFDLSGLHIKDFNLSTGASQVDIQFDEPNRSVIENMNIESGVSKFVAHNLGNANFNHLHFQGGVGSYLLDFTGLRKEVDVDVEVGMGVLTLVVPSDCGARVFYEKSWVSRLECASDIRAEGDNEYVSDNYARAPVKMNIRVDSGLGSVRVRRE